MPRHIQGLGSPLGLIGPAQVKSGLDNDFRTLGQPEFNLNNIFFKILNLIIKIRKISIKI